MDKGGDVHDDIRFADAFSVSLFVVLPFGMCVEPEGLEVKAKRWQREAGKGSGEDWWQGGC